MRMGRREQQTAAGSEHPETFAEHGQSVGNIGDGHRVEDQIETCVRKTGQIPHMPLLQAQAQPFAFRHQPVALQLRGRQIEHGNVRARRRHQGGLLPAPTGQAQHARPGQRRGQPAHGQRTGGRQPHRVQASPPGCAHQFRPHGPRPRAALCRQAFPGPPVPSEDIRFTHIRPRIPADDAQSADAGRTAGSPWRSRPGWISPMATYRRDRAVR